MPIIRSKRPESGFVIVSKTITEDSSLSWAARGLLIHLLGKPDNWRVSLSYLVTQTKDAAKKSGREAVAGLIAELIDMGYVTRSEHQKHDESGHLSGYDYTVFDSPCTGLPTKVQPYKANPTLISNDLEQEMITSTATEKREEVGGYSDKVTSRDMVTMDMSWRPSQNFYFALKVAGRKDDALTPDLLAKFILENNGKKAMQGTFEKQLLHWVALDAKTPRNGSQEAAGPSTKGSRRIKNRFNNINDRNHGETGDL